jgi:hypothetical protein
VNPFVRQFRQPLKEILLALQSPAPDVPWKLERPELEELSIHWPKALEWEFAVGWVEPLFNGFRARVPVKVVDFPPQNLEGTTVIEVHRGKRVYRVGLNCSDYPDIVHLGKDGALDLEFKMQFRKTGYGNPGIVPGGFIANSMLVDWYARAPSRERDRQRFKWDVYGRFGRSFATEVRSRAVSMLESQRRFRFYGGLHKVSFPKFLREVAQSRVCIDLPGNGPFCFRLVNYFAVGACVVSPPHATVMPVPLIDRRHIVYTKPDMSDLVDLCEHYVHDAPAREAIRREAREYYRRHLYWRSLSDYYLRTMLDRLPA